MSYQFFVLKINKCMTDVHKKTIITWIYEDYKSHPLRFATEVSGMIFNLIAALILMWYSPNPPMFWAYIFFLLASVLLMSAAYHRKSFGFTFMYCVYLGIDGIGFLKTLI